MSSYTLNLGTLDVLDASNSIIQVEPQFTSVGTPSCWLQISLDKTTVFGSSGLHYKIQTDTDNCPTGITVGALGPISVLSLTVSNAMEITTWTRHSDIPSDSIMGFRFNIEQTASGTMQVPVEFLVNNGTTKPFGYNVLMLSSIALRNGIVHSNVILSQPGKEKEVNDLISTELAKHLSKSSVQESLLKALVDINGPVLDIDGQSTTTGKFIQLTPSMRGMLLKIAMSGLKIGYRANMTGAQKNVTVGPIPIAIMLV